MARIVVMLVQVCSSPASDKSSFASKRNLLFPCSVYLGSCEVYILALVKFLIFFYEVISEIAQKDGG